MVALVWYPLNALPHIDSVSTLGFNCAGLATGQGMAAALAGLPTEQVAACKPHTNVLITTAESMQDGMSS